MTKFSTFFACAPFGLLALAACSAGGDGTDNSGINGGNGGSSATGGSGVGAIGQGGSAASGVGGAGGGITVGGSGGDTSGAAGMGMSCNSLTATSTLLIPTVLILLDNSSSMFEPSATQQTPWEMLYDVLMDPADGVVKPLENDIRFAFTSYKGHQATGETDPACATMTPAAPTFSLGNFAAIDSIYAMLGSEPKGEKWETPTGFAVATVMPQLVAYAEAPPGPKYILLVTDGNPNTCKTVDPQCGQDRSIKAVQDAYLLGVSTLVVGVGDIIEQPNDGCESAQARCGEAHLQDLANAGSGLPVQAPPMDYQYLNCTAGEGAAIMATYAATGEVPGTAPFFAGNDGAALRTHLSTLLSSVATCTFDLDAIVTGDPTRSLVTLNGSTLDYGDTAAGWTLEDNHYQVTLQGSACETYRAGDTNEVHIEFFCDPAGKPIAEPR